MNYEETFKAMLEAAIAAARGKWRAFQKFAEPEFKRLLEAAAWIEADYIADRIAAESQADPETATKMKKAAKRRAELARENLKIASQAVVIATKADAKLAAQDAVNAALQVLGAAVNKSIGLAIF